MQQRGVVDFESANWALAMFTHVELIGVKKSLSASALCLDDFAEVILRFLCC